ncbi:TNF receptor-associated factor 3-like isoform X2 [Clytia hemisphaerica]|uniref:TNF receptor-associated factor 3-like isoform X2 n=1 Tax=Clytia hemisphaerica TaxID=252671 RepID=UPI0034D66186
MSGGYNFEALNETPKEYECGICSQFLKEAVELACTHAFCGDCLTRCEKDKPKPSCPICRRTYNNTEKHPNHTLNRIITTSMDVKCPLKDDGCEWTGKISDFKHHLCQYKFIKCSLEGCTEIIQRRLEGRHQKSCKHRIIVCLHCKVKIKYNEYSTHSFFLCDEVVVNCPNSGCTEQFKRKNLNHHLCQYKFIKCSLEGCTEIIQRRLEGEHQKRCKHRITGCLYCKAKMKQKEYSAHLLVCDEVVVNCPNSGCTEQLKRKNLDRHKLFSCLYEKVECPFKYVNPLSWRNDYECQGKFLRKDLTKHDQEKIYLHCDQLRRKSEADSRKIRILESNKMVMELQASSHERQIQELEGEVCNLKQTLEEMKREKARSTELLSKQEGNIQQLKSQWEGMKRILEEQLGVTSLDSSNKKRKRKLPPSTDNIP